MCVGERSVGGGGGGVSSLARVEGGWALLVNAHARVGRMASGITSVYCVHISSSCFVFCLLTACPCLFSKMYVPPPPPPPPPLLLQFEIERLGEDASGRRSHTLRINSYVQFMPGTQGNQLIIYAGDAR